MLLKELDHDEDLDNSDGLLEFLYLTNINKNIPPSMWVINDILLKYPDIASNGMGDFKIYDTKHGSLINSVFITIY